MTKNKVSISNLNYTLPKREQWDGLIARLFKRVSEISHQGKGNNWLFKCINSNRISSEDVRLSGNMMQLIHDQIRKNDSFPFNYRINVSETQKQEVAYSIVDIRKHKEDAVLHPASKNIDEILKATVLIYFLLFSDERYKWAAYMANYCSIDASGEIVLDTKDIHTKAMLAFHSKYPEVVFEDANLLVDEYLLEKRYTECM